MSDYSKSRIIEYARELGDFFKTRDPFVIAEKCGFPVNFRKINISALKANTYKYDSLPPIIAINDHYTDTAKTVLCAHELGHALLHSDTVNHYNVTATNMKTNVEYEANLFAVSLLFDDDDFNVPIESMSSYVLKLILDCNIDVCE